MTSVFLSYAHSDAKAIEALTARLGQRDIEVWRDQRNLYGGTLWPKALGRAIADHDAVLLVWSRGAAASEYVELEWCTAIALGKPIVPCLLDGTPLPATLRAIQGVPAAEPNAAADAIHRLVSAQPAEAELAHSEQVIADLGRISSSEPAEVLRAAKEAFNQRGWTVHGDVHITAVRVPPPTPLAKRWQTRVALVVGSLTAAILVFQISGRFGAPAQPEAGVAATVTAQRLAGWIRDESGAPVAGVRVSLPGYDLEDETDKLGRFGFKVVAEPERQVDLVAQKSGYVVYETFATLGNTRLSFTMRVK